MKHNELPSVLSYISFVGAISDEAVVVSGIGGAGVDGDSYQFVLKTGFVALLLGILVLIGRRGLAGIIEL